MFYRVKYGKNFVYFWDYWDNVVEERADRNIVKVDDSLYWCEETGEHRIKHDDYWFKKSLVRLIAKLE